MNIYHRRFAFTLIELLVVLAIIGILMGLLFPAVHAIRESTRRIACGNNIRQLALATLNYESAFERFPQSYAAQPGIATPVPDQWSARARLLRYIEQDNLHDLVDFSQPYSTQLSVAVTRIGTFLCPSEANDVVRVNSAGVPRDYPANYAVNMGTWKIWNPLDGSVGDGAFHVNSKFSSTDFLDGLSQTLMAAEVKAYTPYLRNSIEDPGPNPPNTTAFVATYSAAPGDTLMGPNLMQNTGQTEWADGLCQQSGFTTTFVPNTRVNYTYGGNAYDIDYVSYREGTHATRQSYASITARSYHRGGINIAMMDASVRFLSDEIELATWRAMGSRAGREVY